MDLANVMACWQMFNLEPRHLDSLAPGEDGLLKGIELLTREDGSPRDDVNQEGDGAPHGIVSPSSDWWGRRLKIEPQKWIAGKRRVDFMLTYEDPSWPVPAVQLAIEVGSYRWHFRSNRVAVEHTRRQRELQDEGLVIRNYMTSEILSDPIGFPADALAATQRLFERQVAGL